MHRLFHICLSLVALILCVCTACTDIDGDFTTSPTARLTMEMDTVPFDTVFTGITSSTRRVKVYNHNDKDLRITQVSLSQGEDSPFRVNVDGQSVGSGIGNLEIMAHDSLFMFCEVTPKDNQSELPTVVRDSIVFLLESGVEQYMVLEAWGQDVVILRAPRIETDETWADPRPYVIYDSLVVEEGVTFMIEQGVTLCFHDKAFMTVRGQLLIEGEEDNPVTLRGDRTDRIFSYLPYDRMDAQWGGITLTSRSKDNYIAYTNLRAATWGIDLQPQDEDVMTDNPQLTLVHSSIHNVRNDGLRARYTSLYVANSEISNAGGNCVSLLGGSALFVHTTLAQFYPWSGQQGKALYFTNIIKASSEEEGDTILPLHQAEFQNCLITGKTTDEIQGTSVEDREDIDFKVNFLNCLVNIDLGDANDEKTASARSLFTNCVNETEAFHQKERPEQSQLDSLVWGKKNFLTIDNENYCYDFQLDSLSNARGIGATEPAKLFPYDRYTRPRPEKNPDAGCYQYFLQEKEENKESNKRK